jgi:hypothetical protein
VKSVVLVSAIFCAVPAVFSQQSAPSPELPKGKVVYQRSSSDADAKPVRKSGSDPSVKSEITDADRSAITFTRYALDVRLQPEDHAIAVRAQFTVRNDGTQPLKQLPLQLSSTLDWEEIRIAGTRARFLQSALASDADHTGSLNEAAVVLAQPLPPGASFDLDAIYSGHIPRSAQRLQTIGTPTDVAQYSDWDEITPEFIGLRGFGNVAWYPVASVPVRLGDGDKLFTEIGRVKQREATAAVSIHVTDEARSAVPNVAVLNGTVVPVSVAAGTEQANVPSLVTCDSPSAPLGFQTLSLFLAERHHTTGNSVDVYAGVEKDVAAQAYLSAASQVTPLLRTWLGEQPKRLLSILDLADLDDAPFEERATLYTGLQPAAAPQLTDPLSHSLAHAYFVSPRPWLNEGVAHFMASLWVEQSKSREAALDQLNGQRGALALAEPSPDNLLKTSSSIFYRTKATYVLWMLRSEIGDDTLQSVLKAYDPAADVTDDYFEKLVGKFSKKDVHWLFDDWVYHDRGLPDLSITGIYPSKGTAPSSYLVAVNVTNSGSASAEVPITVMSGTTQLTERMLVPANGNATRRILIQDEPVQIQVNDGTVPEVEASEHVQRVHYTQPTTP